MQDDDLAGRKLSHYRILACVGEGGMGKVYRAYDDRLRRDVAIKVLPPRALTDEHARDHIRDEALALARLKHPNVEAIYDLDHQDGVDFLVVEFVEGNSLAVEIGGRPMRERRVITLGIQIAEALHAAHKERVIHRDLKPRNVQITPDDRVKLLDFGIAKMFGSTDEGDTTETWRETTGLRGTLPYMAPEQLLGEDVDARADIFALGVVLYEMTTGRRPFTRQPDTALIDEICHREPPFPGRLHPDVSPRLEEVILKCLEKSPERRYQSALEVKVDLERAATGSLAHDVRKTRLRELWRRWRARAATLVLSGVGAIVLWNMLHPVPPAPAPLHRQMTFAGTAAIPALSPDGMYFAYVDASRPEQHRVMIQEVSGGKPLPVLSARFCDVLRWSPDGSELLCLTADSSGYGQSYVVPRLGNEVRRFGTEGSVGAWSPDGVSFVTAKRTGASIEITDKATGAAVSRGISGDFDSVDDIDWSPSGERIALLTGSAKRRNEIWTVGPEGGALTRVVSGGTWLASPRWAADGAALYYFRERDGAWDLARLDLARSGRGRKTEVLLTGIQMQPFATFSRDDRRLLYVRETRRSNLLVVRAAPSGRITAGPAQVTAGTFLDSEPSFSPDGASIAFSRAKGTSSNVFVVARSGGEPQPLTFMSARSGSPTWSPDGAEIAFRSDEGGAFRIWRVNARGGPASPWNHTRAGNLVRGFLAWGPSGSILYPKPGERNYSVLDPATGTERRFLEDSSGILVSPQFASDGVHVAALWNHWPRSEVWVFDLEGRSRRVYAKGPVFPVGWSKDDRWIYALDPVSKPRRIMKIDARDGTASVHLEFSPQADVTDAAMSPDGESFAYADNSSQSDVWLVDDFDPTRANTSGRGSRTEGVPASARRR